MSVSNVTIPLRGAAEIDVSSSDYAAPGGCYLYVGTGGDVKVDTMNGNTVTYANVPSGKDMPILVTKVYSSGTTASDLVAQV